MYHEGQEVTKDLAEAAKWYRRAAEQGNPQAQYNPGYMYERGHGVPQDPTQAVAWYQAAAEQCDGYAQNNPGIMLATGRGVPQDHVHAHIWFTLAVNQGIPCENRDLVTAQMTPDQVSEACRLATLHNRLITRRQRASSHGCVTLAW